MKNLIRIVKTNPITGGLRSAYINWINGGIVASKARLDGKVVVITGIASGIGKETAKELSRRGATVVGLDNQVEKGEEAATDINRETKNKVLFHRLDLASTACIKECGEILNNDLKKVDILINNAGVVMCPEMRTTDGFEMQLGINHLGHFLLTDLLMPLVMKAAPGARIINVSSSWHKKGYILWNDPNFQRTPYSSYLAYQQSKLANILFTIELARRLDGSGVTTYSLHPGAVSGTEMGQHLDVSFGAHANYGLDILPWISKTPLAGAQTSIYCAVEESISSHSGRYYSDCRERRPFLVGDSEGDAMKFWTMSERLLGIHAGGDPIEDSFLRMVINSTFMY